MFILTHPLPSTVMKYFKCKRTVMCPMEEIYVLDKLFFCHESWLTEFKVKESDIHVLKT